MSVPLVSIIIPVYNVEAYLHKCLNSILNQTMKDFEVILIDDGSTDKSNDILKYYCSKYKNFKLIEKNNSGVSESRNIGLKHATGKFISFIDSDDFVSPIFLERLCNCAKKTNADIVSCNYYINNSANNKNHAYPIKLKSNVYEKPKILRALIYDTRIHYHVWNKLFKRSIIINNNITFPDMCFEDTEFTIKAFYFSSKIAVINETLYYYVKRNSSLVSNISEKKLNDYLYTLVVTRLFLEYQKDFAPYAFSFFIHSIRTLFITIKILLTNKNISYSLKHIFSIIFYCNSKNFNINSVNKYFDKKCNSLFKG